MCGIAGIVDSRGLGRGREIVRTMCDLLRHRGPDDTGFYYDETCALGQTRLSIIDIDGGHQPIANENKSVWVVCNGEIYNYLELRDELIRKGHLFASETDTEVLVHLYEDHGLELLSKLNGMYAFAIWDLIKRSLFLVRDRLGIKPLYYSLGDGCVIFASEMKAILKDPRILRSLDRDAIADYLMLGYIPEPRTPFKTIKKLSRGCYLQFSEGTANVGKYWSVPRETDGKKLSVEKVCGEIRWLVRDAVRLQLRADVPVGLFASGGLDSTAIMWAASKEGVGLDAFLIEFDELAADTPYARIAASAAKMNLHEIVLSADKAGEILPRLIWHLDEPLADPAIIPAYLVAKEAVDKVKVILNGTGGDELFGGYPRYNIRSLLSAPWVMPLGKWLNELARISALAGKIGAAVDYRQRYLRWISLFPEADIRSALGLERQGGLNEYIHNLFLESLPNDPPNSMMFVDLNLYIPGNLCMLLDKMSMAASLEARVPLLDHRLVELMAALPGRLKMQGKELKWLFRKALRGHISDAILDRPKQGFGPPVSKWLAGSLGNMAQRLLLSKSSQISTLFSPNQLSCWLDNSDRFNKAKIWRLMILELWLRVFIAEQDVSSIGMRELTEDAGEKWI